jgi:hypothetical protein
LLGNSKIVETTPNAVTGYPLLLFWQNNGNTDVRREDTAIAGNPRRGLH